MQVHRRRRLRCRPNPMCFKLARTQIHTPGRANSVLSYFQLGDEGLRHIRHSQTSSFHRQKSEDSFQEQGTVTPEKVKKVGRPLQNQRENKKGKAQIQKEKVWAPRKKISDSKYEEEIHNIKRRQNEGLKAFMDRFKSKSSYIKGVPPVLRISAFMYGHGYPELAKKLNDKIPKMVDDMFERVRPFIKGEVAKCSVEMVHPSQWDKGNVHPTWSGGPKKARNRGGPRET
nr:reverse transcriptase domain-containing protein [Tanacetum cinerariifolium]